MKQIIIKQFFSSFILLIFPAIISAQNYAAQSAWGYGVSATGGAGGTVVTVTTMASLVSELKSSGKKIILVSGTLTCNGTQKVSAKDKTVIGLPGAVLSNPEGRDKSTSGILSFSNSSNLIIRNLTFKSAGAYDCDGSDNLCFDGVTNAWVDHCDFQDGVDGNFDNKGNTDNITVSWCRFRYLIEAKAGGSGGSDDHRFTNLLGSNATDKPADGRYNITWAYCWWDNGCRERMVRGRNADLHFLNCYWNSSVANYYIGPENLGAYVEGCTFEGKANSASAIWKSYGGTNPAAFVNCTGNLPKNSGNPVVPEYSYTALTAAASKTAVTGSCGAGATLKVDAKTGAVSSSCTDAITPTILDNPIATYTINETRTDVTWEAIPNASSYKVKICGTPGTGTNKSWNFNNEATAAYTANANLTNGISVVSSGKQVSVAAGSGIYDGVKITNIIKLAGGGSTTDCALKLTTESAGILTVYCNAADKERFLLVSNSTSVLNENAPSSNMVEAALPAAGTYYLYSAGSGIDIYYMKLNPTSTCSEYTVPDTSYSMANATGSTIYVQAVGNGSSYLSSEYTQATESNPTHTNIDISTTNNIQLTQTITKLTISGVEVSAIYLYDVSGIQTGCVKDQQFIDTDNLTTGIYIARIQTTDGKILVKKFMK